MQACRKLTVLLNVVFDYEETDTSEEMIGRAPAWNVEGLGQLPRELLENLRNATKSGNRKLLKRLIVEVRDTAGDTGSALALQQLADKYEYDVLWRLLEEACRP